MDLKIRWYWCVTVTILVLMVVLSHVGLSRWLSGKESTCQCRRHGLHPWSRKNPHAPGQVNLCITTTELVCLEPILRNERGYHNEEPEH